MGTFFELGKDKAAKGEGWGFVFHQLCPRYSGTLTPTAPMANRLWETFTFTFYYLRTVSMHAVFFHKTLSKDIKSLLEVVQKNTACSIKHFNICLLLTKTRYLHFTT